VTCVLPRSPQVSAFTGKCPDNPNAWAFSLLPADAADDDEVCRSTNYYLHRRIPHALMRCRDCFNTRDVQVKAGVVQSSGIVSIASVPFGRYEVKLTAEMKGQPARGWT
jgi:hypothetical protein